MKIDEIFPSPTVKQVIFQLTFPNLFFLEDRIGGFQLKIMKEFPHSSLLRRDKIVFADIGPEMKMEDISGKFDEKPVRKIWQFVSDRKVRLNVMTDSLDISSNFHKTYNLGDKDKFRDIIKFVTDNFIGVMELPIINRIGLRYIDECPIPSRDTATFRSFYNSAFPIDRFDISESSDMDFQVITKRGEYNLRYAESLQNINNKFCLMLDFDGFANKIEPNKILDVTDKLHEIILDEYEKTIKEPVIEQMRQERQS